MARITIPASTWETMAAATRAELRASAGGVALGLPIPNAEPATSYAWDDPRIDVAAVLAKATELGVTITDETPSRPDGMPDPGPYVPPDVFIPPPAEATPDPLLVLVDGLAAAHTIAEIRAAASDAKDIVES